MKVKALAPIYYGGTQYAPGDEYEMDDRDGQEAATLVALGKIEILPKQSQWNVMPGEEAEPIPSKEQPKSPARVMTTENTSTITPAKDVEDK